MTVTENLNRAQREAAEHTDGPLLIIAGAGTGKTRVITSRILHLMLDVKVPSSQILALTFTEKATEEMQARVDEMMPLSYEEITIKTFHGFCDAILRERGMEIGIDPGYSLLTPAQQWLMLKQNLFAFELDFYRPLGNPYKFLHTLLGHFSRLKDEDILPERYVEHAEKMIADAVDDVEKEEGQKMLEVAKAYATYQRLMAEQNCLDFGDLQFYALRLFEKRPSVLKEMQQRFRYIMVDEFQDTNLAQNKLVMMLANEHKNLVVVGDDDQAIYKWRGASLSNIRQFEERFPEAKKVVLTENYRSTQTILDTAYDVVQKNNPFRLEHEAQIDKKLIAKGYEDAGEPVEVHHFLHYSEEVKHVIEGINKAVADGASYKDVAILVRANQHAAPFIEAMKDAEIPFTVRDTQGLLRFEEIKDLVAVLRFLAKPQDDVAYFRMMSFPMFGIDMGTILEAIDGAKKAGFSPLFYYLQKSIKKNEQTLPGLEEESPFEEVLKLSQEVLEFSRNHDVYRTLGQFLDLSGYVRRLMAEEIDENAEKIQHIAEFLEMVKEFEADGQQERPALAFLEYLDSLQEALGAIPSTTEIERDAVSILSVHGSKGLEFGYVFVPTLVNHRFPGINRKDPLPIPEELIMEELPGDDLHINEERRLFYVACTRAKQRLFLSYSDAYEGKKKWKVSPFVLEALECASTREIDHTENAEEATADRVHGSLTKHEEVETPMIKKILTVPEIDVRQLSYSKVAAFETCPLKYKFRYYFKIPTPQPHAANFGSSIHNTVNAFYEQRKGGKEVGLDGLKELYEEHWIGAGYESRGHEAARKKMGWETLQNFYTKEEEAGFKVPAFLERGFRLKLGNVVFSGRIDRIDQLEDGTYEVIDYKTGTSKRNINLKKDLQLSLYALACKEIFRIPISQLSLYYLEDASKASTERTEKDLAEVKAELLEVVEDMKTSDMKPTPGFHCGFCEYRVLCHAAA